MLFCVKHVAKYSVFLGKIYHCVHFGRIFGGHMPWEGVTSPRSITVQTYGQVLNQYILLIYGA